MKLIVIPYAAGTAYAFQTIRSMTNSAFQMDVFEYPGHGQKMCIPLLHSIPELAQAVMSQMFPVREPYCLLGYSMGGHVLCELYRLLIEKQYPLPYHIFLCGSDIPNQQLEEETDSSDQALLKELTELGGTPQEVLEDPEFLDLLLPIFRADILAEKNYVLPYEQLFRCEGTVIMGKAELKEDSHFSEWQRYFEKPVRFCQVNGGHFFMKEEPELFAEILINTMQEYNKWEMPIKQHGGSGIDED